MSKKKKLSPYQKRKLQEERLKRLQRKQRLHPSLLFGPQREFVESKHPRVVASCSRRAGKSYGEAYKLLEWGMDNPASIIPYITLTREAAKDIIHAPLRELAEAANIPLKVMGNTGDVVLPNESKIIMRGCEDKRQVEKLRGPKYPGAVIDEAQGIPGYLNYMLDEVLAPALLDYKDSQIYLTGTPNAACAGAFYDIIHSPPGAWDVHSWTMLDNASYADRGIDVAAFMEQQRAVRGLSVDDPAFLREFRGIWVRDSESQVYKYKASRNDITRDEWQDLKTSTTDWEFVMGLDLGWNDPSAFVVGCYSSVAGRFVVLESFQASEMSTDEIHRKIRQYFSKYGEMSVYADSGGYGKSIVEGLSRDYNLPVIPADKTAKASHIEFVNNDLRSAALRILEGNGELTECLTLLQWSAKSIEKGVPKEDKRYQNHLCDALLYSVRMAFHNDGVHEEQEPAYMSKEWFKREEDRREEELERRVMMAQAGEDDLDAQEAFFDSFL